MLQRTFAMLPAIILLIAAPAAVELAQAGEWSGDFSGQVRVFPFQAPSDEQFEGLQPSAALNLEYFEEWDDGRQQFVLAPFLRLDGRDDERSHADLRELFWSRAADDWELRIGLRRVFWGVTEFQHLVDIINQTDLIENQDGEDKLGQPMLNLALIRDWGTVDLFLLPGFRERTFPGREGRPSGGLVVNTDDPQYASGAEQKRLDFALRYAHSFGDWDVGLGYFEGTAREPDLTLRIGSSGAELVPFYDVIRQTSLDLQYTGEEWLLKLETLHRSGRRGNSHSALTGGFEYTVVGLFESDLDLGLIAEYAYDDRRDRAPTPFQNDIILGARLALNDAESTELLAGMVFDLSGGGRFYSLEASRRIGDDYKLSVEARLNDDIPVGDVSFPFRNEDYLQLELSWFF